MGPILFVDGPDRRDGTDWDKSYGIRMGLISIMGSSRLKLLFLLIKVVKSRNYPPPKILFSLLSVDVRNDIMSR